MSIEDIKEIKYLQSKFRRTLKASPENKLAQWATLIDKEGQESQEFTLSSLRAELFELKKDLEFTKDDVRLVKKLVVQNGEYVNSQKERLIDEEVFSFEDKEIQACMKICLEEIETTKHPLFPSDIAKKFDLDVVLVSYCLETLEKEGKIIEAGNIDERKD